MLKRDSPESFDAGLLRRSLHRAARMIAEAGPDGEACDDHLRRLLDGSGYVDPYRLTTSLNSRRQAVPVADLLKRVYL